MGIIGWLILSLGTFVSVYGTECLPETVMCSPHWVQMDAYKDLFESEEELNAWCRKQSLFFRCLDDVLLVKYGNYSKFPTNMLVSKMLSQDLCLEGSTSRRRYLDNAACINKLNLDYCKMPEFLDILIPDDVVPKQCASSKTFSCIAATMVFKCGFDAGRVYKYLLKVTKYVDEMCGVESSESVTCEETPNSDGDKLSEIYYGLVNRFGSIPEQATEAGLMDEKEPVSESTISESLNKAFDAMEYSDSIVESEKSTSDNEVNRSKDELRKWPVILEQFKGLLFYNYSNEEFEFYWRQPGSFPIDRVTCGHVVTPHMKAIILECVVYHRSKEPECYYNTKPTTTERITPELIRDIDSTIPEDSSLDISERLDLTQYLLDYQRYRIRWEYWISARLVMHIDSMREMKKYLVKQYPNDKVCSKELRYFDIINDRNISWWQCPSLFSDELRNEIVTFLFGKRTIQDVLFLSVFNEDDKSYVHLFEPLLHAFDEVVCERVNECHPRGRGVFKCSLKRRDLKGCDNCCSYNKKATCSTQSEREVTEIKSSETFDNLEGSGAFEDLSVQLDEEATIRTEESGFVTGVIGENGDLVALDLSELQSDSISESSSDANRFLSQDFEGSGENEFLARSGVMFTSEKTPNDDLLELEFELSDDNTYILKPVPSIANFEAAYEMDFGIGL